MSPRKVIVRAWGDEPVELVMRRIERGRAYVGKETADRTIGIPLDEVFQFDAAMFSRLREAYQAGNKSDLAKLYAGIAPVIEGAND